MQTVSELQKSCIQGTHVCKAKQDTAAVITTLQLGYSKVIHHSQGALTAYLAHDETYLGEEHVSSWGSSLLLAKPLIPREQYVAAFGTETLQEGEMENEENTESFFQH